MDAIGQGSDAPGASLHSPSPHLQSAGFHTLVVKDGSHWVSASPGPSWAEDSQRGNLHMPDEWEGPGCPAR